MLKSLRRAFYYIAIVGVVIVSFQLSPALAARPDSFKDTISDSRPSTGAINTFVDDIASGSQITAGTTVTFLWPSGFTFPSDGTWTTGDFSFNDGTSRTIVTVGAAPTCTAGVNNVSVTASSASRTLVVTACSTYTAGSLGALFTFVVGVGGTHTITNHATPGSYQINVAGTGGYIDSAQDTAIVITTGTTLSATVDETLTLTVGGVASGSCQTTGGTTITSTSTTVPYATVTPATFYDICQSLTVATNATGGYTLTNQTTSLPTAGSSTIAKGVCDASCSDTTANAWATATNYGYGYCMKDTTNTAANTADSTAWTASNQCGGGTQKFKTVANAGGAQTAQQLMKATATTASDVSNVGYRLTVSAAQAAGAYSTNLVYITTGTF